MSSPIRVLVTDKISTSGLGALLDDDRFQVIVEHDPASDAFQAALPTVHGLVVRSATKVRGELLAAATSLKVVGRAGVGVDNIDIAACTERGIAVINAPAGNTVSAAELTMALILSVVRKVAAADRSMREGKWARSSFQGTELRGKTLGLVGGGRIGSEVARRCRAFGMDVLLYDPFLSEEKVRQIGAEPAGFDEIVSKADVVSLHVPLNDDTRDLFDLDRLRGMKKGAVLVNVARGGVVNEAALAQVLEEGHLAGAALDVYETEPLAEDSVLRSAPNLVLTPHLGASTEEAQEKVSEEIAASVAAALADGDLSPALNAPGVGGDTLRKLNPVLDLGDRLGVIAAGLAPGAVKSVAVRYAGELREGMSLLPRHVLVGILRPAIGLEVNVVNAGVLAEGRGIETSLTQVAAVGRYQEHVQLHLETDAGPLRVRGAILGPGHPRIVEIDDFKVSVEPEGILILLRNRDVPGVIGKVGSLLGANSINIAGYFQARSEEGGHALAALRVDDHPPAEVMQSLRDLPEIDSAHVVDLG